MLINLISVLFLVVTLVVGTKVVNDKSMSLNINEKAAKLGKTGNSAFDKCREESGREVCNERLGINVNWKGEIVNEIDTSKVDKDAKPGDKTCDANGVQYSPGAVVMYGGIGSNATCGSDGKWNVGVGATIAIKPENVPEYAKGSDKLKKQIEVEEAIAEAEKQVVVEQAIEPEEIERIQEVIEQEQKTQVQSPIQQKEQQAAEQQTTSTTSTSLEKTDEGFIRTTTTITRDATGKVIDAKSISTTAKTTSTFAQTPTGLVRTDTKVTTDLATGKVVDTSKSQTTLKNSVAQPTTSITINQQGSVSIKEPAGSVCTFSSDCESGGCGIGGERGGVTKTCQTSPVNQFANITAGVSGRTIPQKQYVPPLLPTVPTAEDLLRKIPGLEKLNINDIKNFNYPTQNLAQTIQPTTNTQQTYNFADCNREGLTPDQTAECNRKLSKVYDAPIIGRYIQSYANKDIAYNYEQMGYGSVSECVEGEQTYPGKQRCNGYQPTNEQFASSVALGTAGTAVGALVVASGGAATGAITGYQAIALAMATSTMYQTGSAVDICVTAPDSPECKNAKLWAGVSWLNVGSSGLANAYQASKLAQGINTAVNVANVGADAFDISQSCGDGQFASDFGCVAAWGGLVFDVGQGGVDIARVIDNNLSGLSGNLGSLPDVNSNLVPDTNRFFATNPDIPLDSNTNSIIPFDATGNNMPKATEITIPQKFTNWWDETFTNPISNYLNRPTKLSAEENTLNRILDSYDTYGERIKNDISISKQGGKDGIKTAFDDLTVIANEKGYKVQLVNNKEFVNVVTDNKIVSERINIDNSARISADETTLYVLEHPKVKGLPQDIDGMAHDVGAILLGGKTTKKGMVASFNADFISNSTAGNISLDQVIDKETGKVPSTWLLDSLIKNETPRSLFINNIEVTTSPTIPQKFTNWVKAEMAKTNPNAFKNINEDFSNFWQNNVYSPTDGFLPKWTDVNDNPIINRIIGSPEDINLRPNEVANPLPTVDNAPTTPLTTRVGDLWDDIINPKFDTTSPTTQKIIKDLEGITTNNNALKSNSSIDEYIKGYGEPKYIFTSEKEATKMYAFQKDIIKIKSVDDYEKIYSKVVSKLNKNGVKVIVYDRLYDFIDKVGNGHLGTLGTSDSILFSNGKRSSTVSIASPELLRQIFKINGVDISLDTAKMITLQKIGHEGGHSFDWMGGLKNDDPWLTEIRQKNFNFQFYEHIGSKSEARYYQGFLEEFRKRFGGS